MRRVLISAIALASLLVPSALLSPGARSQTIEDVATAAKPSVAAILARHPDGLVSGTGFMAADRMVLTAYHVVEGATQIVLKFPDYPAADARLVQADRENDVAALAIPGLPVRPLPLGDVAGLREGQTIVVIGFPRIEALGAETATVTEGIVSAIRPGLIQMQAPISPGDSGGPVLNLRGEVVGIARATLRGPQQGINFATAINAAKPFLSAAIPAPAMPLTAPAPPPLPAATQPRPAGAAAETLHLGYATWVGYGPLFLARDNRYFDEAGVNVELTPIENPKLRFAALAAGRLDGLVTTLDTMTLYWKPTFQVQAVLGLDDSKGGDGIVSTSSITTIKDLRGKRVAFNEGSVSHFFLSVLLRENGMSEEDLQAINMRQDDAGAAFLSGKVDAAVTWEPWLTRAKRAPGGHVLVDSSTTPGLIVDVLVIRKDVIKAHPNAVKAAVAAWYQAVDYWKANEDDADAAMAKAVGGWLKDVKTFKETLAGVRYYDKAINASYMAPEGQIYKTVQNAVNIWTALGKITEKETTDDLIDSEFVR